MGDNQNSAERDTRNRGLQEEEERLHDPDKRPPHGDGDEGTEPARPASQPDTDDIANLENPPQKDGPRERSNDSV
jgi:hypothetical protein